MDQSRRRFLSLFGLSANASRSDSSMATSGGAQLQNLGPVIDASLCHGCDACAAVCDDGAIVLDNAGEGLAYLLRAATCTACDACVAVCDVNAVSLIRYAFAEKRVRVSLQDMRCGTCRVGFHWPTQRGGVIGICPSCASRRQASRQVRS